MLSFFALFMMPDQDGNWTLTALLIIVSAALFAQIGGFDCTLSTEGLINQCSQKEDYMEKEYTVSINENDIAKIAVLNSIRVEDVDSKF